MSSRGFVVVAKLNGESGSRVGIWQGEDEVKSAFVVVAFATGTANGLRERDGGNASEFFGKASLTFNLLRCVVTIVLTVITVVIVVVRVDNYIGADVSSSAVCTCRREDDGAAVGGATRRTVKIFELKFVASLNDFGGQSRWRRSGIGAVDGMIFVFTVVVETFERAIVFGIPKNANAGNAVSISSFEGDNPYWRARVQGGAVIVEGVVDGDAGVGLDDVGAVTTGFTLLLNEDFFDGVS